MAGSIFRDESPLEYFRELVHDALHHQGIEASELTAFYVVNLLSGFVTRERGSDALDDAPLGLRLAHALESGGIDQREELRRVGDLSLFTSGFFSDSLRRQLVDIDYYVTLGGLAYGSLSRSADRFSPVFAELSERFVTWVDVLTEVSERSALTSNTDLLRLYERWLRTGSQRTGNLLAARGIVPNASIGSRFIQ